MNGSDGHTGGLRALLAPRRLAAAGLILAGAAWWVAASLTRPFWR